MKGRNNTSKSSLTMVLITWIIISFGFFIDNVVAQGKKRLECYECTHDEKCAETHEPGEVFKCPENYQELLEKVKDNKNGKYDEQINEFFEQFGGGAGGIFPIGPNGKGGGGFNPLGPGGGGKIDWSKNPFFQRLSTDNSTDGTEEESDPASRQFNILPQPQLIWYCGRKEEGGKVTRFCKNQQPGVRVGNTCPPKINKKGIKCSFCNTNRCNGNGKDGNGSTQLGQMSTWGVIILSALLTLIPLSLL